jgi:hypothetical protein
MVEGSRLGLILPNAAQAGDRCNKAACRSSAVAVGRRAWGEDGRFRQGGSRGAALHEVCAAQKSGLPEGRPPWRARAVRRSLLRPYPIVIDLRPIARVVPVRRIAGHIPRGGFEPGAIGIEHISAHFCVVGQ